MPTWIAVVASGLSIAVALPFAELGICAASIVVAVVWVWWLVTRRRRVMAVAPNAPSASTQSVLIDRGSVGKHGEGQSLRINRKQALRR